MSDDHRPVFLNLFQIRFPVTAIVSIGHRLSGMVLVLSLPAWLWMLQETLASAARFDALQACLADASVRVLLWLAISAAGYHVLAGLRHLAMDCGWWESLTHAKRSAYAVLILALLLAIWVGVKLW